MNKYPALGCDDAYQISCSHSSRSPADRLPRIGVCARWFVRKIYWLKFPSQSMYALHWQRPTPRIITLIGQGDVRCVDVSSCQCFWRDMGTVVVTFNMHKYNNFSQIIIFFCFISSHRFVSLYQINWRKKAHPILTHCDGIKIIWIFRFAWTGLANDSEVYILFGGFVSVEQVIYYDANGGKHVFRLTVEHDMFPCLIDGH